MRDALRDDSHDWLSCFRLSDFLFFSKANRVAGISPRLSKIADLTTVRMEEHVVNHDAGILEQCVSLDALGIQDGFKFISEGDRFEIVQQLVDCNPIEPGHDRESFYNIAFAVLQQ